MHPLAPDLTQLTNEELHKKIHELTQKLTQSYRLGNYELVGQIHMLLDDYNHESQRRHQKTLEEMSNKNQQFDGIINIK
jgi:hypothetical protein